MNRQGILDISRLLACLMVVFYHWAFTARITHYTWFSYPVLHGMAKYGFLGVQLFFIISGYVILFSAGSGDCRKFLISRAARVLPSFWICCTATAVVVTALAERRFRVDAGQYLENVALVPLVLQSIHPSLWETKFVDPVYWSLMFEIKFYLLVAGLIVVGALPRIERFLWAWLILSGMEIFHGLPKNLTGLLMLKYAMYFVAGGFFHRIRAEGLTLSRGLGVAAAFLCACAQLYHQGVGMTRSGFGPYSYMTLLLVVGAFFLVFCLLAAGRLALEAPLLTRLSAMTYPVYLIHMFAGLSILNALPTHANRHILFWSLLAGMLALLFAYVEYVEPRVSGAMRTMLERVLRVEARPRKPKAPPRRGRIALSSPARAAR